jgi:hypothetical protein
VLSLRTPQVVPWGVVRAVRVPARPEVAPFAPSKKAPTWHTIWYTDLVHRMSYPKSLLFFDLYWAALDLNQRLPPCEDGTLTTELAARLSWT